MSQVMGCAAYEDGRRIGDLNIDELDRFEPRKGAFVWIGLHEPDEALLGKVQRRFNLHELAIEDAHRAHQRPKLEVYGDSLFIVLRTAQLIGGKIQFGESHIFAGKGYIITVRHGPSASYGEVRARCERQPKMLKEGEDFVIYSILDFVVDNYIPVVDELEAEVERLEEQLSGKSFTREMVDDIYGLKRDLLELRRAVTPVVEMTNRLMRFDVPLVDKATYPYFRDVHDHALRVAESIDYLRELLNSALEVNLLVSTNNQGEVTRKLASWAAILAVPTAVAGIYGMNFTFMPELTWRFGYPLILLVILGLCSFLYYRFKLSGWL
jgi:magnesium transporter